MEATEKEKRISQFKEEYFQLHTLIDSFDTKTLTIFISHTQVLLLLASFSAFVFWILEYYWKSFQYPHFMRVDEIENYINGSIDSLEPMQIGKSWENNHKSGGAKRFFTIFKWSNVMTPHIYVLLCGAGIFIAHKMNWVTV